MSIRPPLFAGLRAFPLTPVTDGGIDAEAFTVLVGQLADARVDSITALGSTGSYAYLDRSERRQAVELAVAAAGDVPVFAGIGAIRTRDVLAHTQDAQAAGAAALLLAPVSYQRLTDGEVYALFEDVAADSSVPLIVYDNPGTTGFTFTDDLHARIAALDAVAAIKIPPVAGGYPAVQDRIRRLRGKIPVDVSIGISGDAVAADALRAGCDAWYSVLAGTMPGPFRAIVDAIRDGNPDLAIEISERLRPVWDLFDAYGSYRVVSAIAEGLGLVSHPSLPRPVLGLDPIGRQRVRNALTQVADHTQSGDRSDLTPGGRLTKPATAKQTSDEGTQENP